VAFPAQGAGGAVENTQSLIVILSPAAVNLGLDKQIAHPK
jgi:hypothetical protein